MLKQEYSAHSLHGQLSRIMGKGKERVREYNEKAYTLFSISPKCRFKQVATLEGSKHKSKCIMSRQLQKIKQQ